MHWSFCSAARGQPTGLWVAGDSVCLRQSGRTHAHTHAHVHREIYQMRRERWVPRSSGVFSLLSVVHFGAYSWASGCHLLWWAITWGIPHINMPRCAGASDDVAGRHGGRNTLLKKIFTFKKKWSISPKGAGLLVLLFIFCPFPAYFCFLIFPFCFSAFPNSTSLGQDCRSSMGCG